MSAPDNWRKGSWRGVPFWWTEATGKPGRRTVRHDYPQRDDAYVEDLGKKAPEFTLQVYVLGDDYIAQRDRLEDACNQPGPGTLVHPTRGEMQVVCTGCEVTESTRERRQARFSLTFVKGAENNQPQATVDTRALVAEKADAADIAVAGDFAEGFSVEGLPAFVAEEAAAVLEMASDEIAGALAGPMRMLGKGNQLATAAMGLRGNALGLVQMPQSLAGQVTGLLSRFGSLLGGQGGYGGSGAGALRPLARLGGFGADLPTVQPTTTARRQQAANQAALAALVRQASAVEAARLSAGLSFDSYDDAAEVRTIVVDRLDEERSGAGDRVFRAFGGLVSAVVRDTTTRGASRERLAVVQTEATLPAVVVAHRLLGDAARADEIATRNRIRNRLFVPGGVPLEVLNGSR
ncbi:MAG: DNA circularization N-terminal domain-containing protein [Pseudomonadota bacterium]